MELSIHDVTTHQFCLIEVKAMVVVVQQPPAECAAILNRFVYLTLPASGYKTSTVHQQNGWLHEQCPNPISKLDAPATYQTLSS